VLQVPVDSVQTEGAVHLGAPPQTPAVQTSPMVQFTPSLQVVPFGATGALQEPVDSWQTPWVWHESAGAGQVVCWPPQVPLVQTSVVVHILPSSQTVPLGLGTPPAQRPVALSQIPAWVHAEPPEH
jgi:hypothetical protein